jgi:hypothetical protein
VFDLIDGGCEITVEESDHPRDEQITHNIAPPHNAYWVAIGQEGNKSVMVFARFNGDASRSLLLTIGHLRLFRCSAARPERRTYMRVNSGTVNPPPPLERTFFMVFGDLHER